MKGSTLAIIGGLLMTLAAIAGLSGAGPVPKPVPEVVSTAPFKTDFLSVLIVEQTEEVGSLPKSQQVVLQNNTQLRKWTKDNGVDFRQIDADESGEFLDAKWKAALAVPRKEVPWIVIANSKSGYSGPLPQTTDETIALIGKFK